MLPFWGLLLITSFVQGKTPPDIIKFAERRTGKVALDQPNDVKASTEGFRLLCTTNGTIPMTFSWKYNDQPLNQQRGISMIKTKSNEETLWVQNSSPMDDGKYQCFAKNAYGGTFSPKLPIKVTYASYFEEKETFVKNLIVVVGRPLRLICPQQSQSAGSKDFGAVYLWARKKGNSLVELKPTKNRALLPNGNYLFLYLSEADTDDIAGFPDGTVQCVINAGNLIYFSHQFELNVQTTEKTNFGPEFQTATDRPKSQEQAIQGKSKELFCAAVGYPVPKMTWYRLKNDKSTLKKVEDGKEGFLLKDFGRKLTIDIVSKAQHEGYYQCVASNGVNPDVKSPPTELQVFVAPTWMTEPPKVLSVPFQSDMSFKCEALGSPPLYYKWYHNATLFKSDDELAPNIMVDGKYLRFKKMQYHNQGVFQCSVENDYGMLVSSTWVKVKTSKPEIQNFGPFYLFKGTTATLKCESDAAPRATHTWVHNGTNVEIKGRFSQDKVGALIIRDVDYSDAGKYKCTAENAIGNDDAEAEATVYEKTTISREPPANVSVELDKPLDLQCEASADQKLKGSLKYKWLKDNAPLKYDKRVQWNNDTNELTISKAVITDGAKYKCVAYTDTKQYSDDTATTTADVKGVPFPPYDLKITDCTNRTISITWKKRQDNDSPTTKFIIEQESTYFPDEWLVIASISDPDARQHTLKPTLWADLTFRMRAVNKIGASRASEPTPKGQCVTNQGLPTMFPENLRGIPGKAGELDIAWTAMNKLQANAPGLYYILYYAKADSQEPFSPTIIKDPKNERFTVPNAGNYIKWKFQIVASNKIGRGPISDIEESFSGQNAPQRKPTDVNITKVLSRSIELSWKRVDVFNNSGNIDGYKIYVWRKHKSDKRRKRREIPPGASVFTAKHTNEERQTATLTGLTPHSSYSLALKAFNSGGEGPMSDEHSFDTKREEIEKPFKVTCTKDIIEIALKSSEFGGGNFKTESATLIDTNCKAKRLNNTHVYMETPLDGCGTYHNYSSDGRYVIYYNHIVLQRTSKEDSALITRDHQAVFEFECLYHRRVVLSVVHYTPSRATVFTATENFGNFTYMMRMFKSKEYKEAYDKFPVYVMPSKDVYIQTDVTAKDADLVLLVDFCTATPSKNRNDKEFYDLIKEGCAKDQTLKYDHQLSSVQRFNFKAFYFNVDKQATVHLHCTVRVCRKADKNSRCVKGCQNRRRKRAAANANKNDEITGSLSIGPIQLQESSTGKSTASDSPKMFVEIVVGVLGFFVVVLLVAVTVVLLKRRRQPRKEGLSLMVDDSGYY